MWKYLPGPFEADARNYGVTFKLYTHLNRCGLATFRSIGQASNTDLEKTVQAVEDSPSRTILNTFFDHVSVAGWETLETTEQLQQREFSQKVTSTLRLCLVAAFTLCCVLAVFVVMYTVYSDHHELSQVRVDFQRSNNSIQRDHEQEWRPQSVLKGQQDRSVDEVQEQVDINRKQLNQLRLDFQRQNHSIFGSLGKRQHEEEQLTARLQSNLHEQSRTLGHIQEQIAKIQVDTPESELKLFIDECPPGWLEADETKGYLLTGRPDGGKAGERLNRPLQAGESTRVPAHTHSAIVADPGHDHVVTYHTSTEEGVCGAVGALSAPPFLCLVPGSEVDHAISTNIVKTGISVTNEPNKDGESYPLVYVLVCRRDARKF